MSFTSNLIKEATIRKISGVERILTNGAVGATTGAITGGLAAYMRDKGMDDPSDPLLHRFYNPSSDTFIRGAFRGGLAGGLSGLLSGSFADPSLNNIPGLASGAALGVLGGSLAPTDGEVSAMAPLWDKIDEIEEMKDFYPGNNIKQGSMTKEALGDTAKARRKLILTYILKKEGISNI